MKPNIIVDGSNMAWRMFSTLDLSNSDGELVSVIFGMIKNIHSLVEKFEPKRVIVCWDTDESSRWRKEIYPEYKSNRTKFKTVEEEEESRAKKEEYARQRDILQYALSWLPISQIIVDELEADDIAYLLATNILHKENNILVSTDKDWLQILSNKTMLYSPIKDIMVANEDYEFDAPKAKTFEEYMGFEFEKFLDFKVLQGDTSDGIAGIPGIGEKTALKLLEEHGSIEAMFEKEGEMRKSKRNARIVESPKLVEDLRSIMDISYVKKYIEKPLLKVRKGIIEPSEDYKKFWNFARDNDFKSIFMDYRIWCRPFEEMGAHSIPARKKKKRRKLK